MQIGSDQPLCQALVRIIVMNPPNAQTLKNLQLLHKLLQNIVNDPYSAQFRRILTSNKVINELLSVDGVLTFLTLMGFVDKIQGFTTVSYELDSIDSLQPLQQALFMLKLEIDSFQVCEVTDTKTLMSLQARRKKFEDEEAYKLDLIKSFESNKREVYQEKIEQSRSQNK